MRLRRRKDTAGSKLQSFCSSRRTCSLHQCLSCTCGRYPDTNTKTKTKRNTKTTTKANTNLQSASMSGTCGRVCLHRPEGRERGREKGGGEAGGLISVLPHVRPTTTTMGAAATALVGRGGETAKMGDWGWSVNNAGPERLCDKANL